MGIGGLDFQPVDIRFTKGLDTRSQEKLRLPGTWDTLDNLTLSKNNALRRRDGTAPLVSTNGNGLALHNEELLVLDGSALSSVSVASTPATAAPMAGQVANCFVRRDGGLIRTTNMQDQVDCAYGGGFTCYAWREKDGSATALGVDVMVVDEVTGAVLMPGTRMRTAAGAFCPRVVATSSGFYVFYISLPILYCRFIAYATPTSLGAETTLINSANLAGLNYDACPNGAGTAAAVLYGWTDGATSVRAIGVAGNPPAIAIGPTNVVTEVQLPVANLTGLAVTTFANSSYGCFTRGTGASAMAGTSGTALNTALAITAGPAQIDTNLGVATTACHLTACAVGAGIQVFSDERSAWGTLAVSPIRTVAVSSAMAVTSAARTLINSASFRVNATEASGPKGPWIYGKAFVDSGGNALLPCCVQENYQSLGTNTVTNSQQCGLYILDGATGTVLGRALYGTFGVAEINANPPNVCTPCSVASVGGGDFALPAPERGRLVLQAGLNVSPTGICRLTLSPEYTRPPSRVQLGGITYFAGGVLSAYDGFQVVEHGFLQYPEGISLVANGAASGSMTAGVHQVVFVYEWVDNSGARHQSAPSPAVSITTVATDSLTCRIPTLLLSQKTNIQVVPYMTQAGGLTFNRVNLNAGTFVPLINITTAAYVTFTISDADATIAGNELLYTQPNQAGTVLPNISPPPCTALAVHQERLFFDAADAADTYRYSQQLTPGVGLQTSDLLSGTIDVNAGGVVGFSVLDEKLIIFGARRIYGVFGTGPNSAGAYNNFSDPTEVPTDVGCSELRSILRMPSGVIFKSPKGWQLLQRDLTVRYIGEGVARWDTQTVSAAVLLEDRQECRFTTADGGEFPTSGSYGYTLVYSYQVEGADFQWSTTSYNFDSFSYKVQDAIWWPTLGAFVHVSPTLGTNKDVPGTWTDGNSGGTGYSVITTARTGWLRVHSLEGFERVRWLYLTMSAGAAPDSTKLDIKVDFDDIYSALAPGAYTVSVNLGAISFSSPAAVDLRHKLKRQKCKSVAFTFQELEPGSSPVTGLEALTLQVGIKRGTNKTKAAQNVG